MVDCTKAVEGAMARKAQQQFIELREFLEAIVALDPHDTILEIGIADGGTTWAFHQIAKRVATIDSGREQPGGLHVTGDSQLPETLKKITKKLGTLQLDCLFIDGGHTYENTKTDWEMYSPLVRSGGIIGLHDIAGRNGLGLEVRRCWEEIKATGVDWKEAVAKGSGQGIGYWYVK